MARGERSGGDDAADRLLIPGWVLVVGAALAMAGGALWVRHALPESLGAAQAAPRLAMGSPRWSGTPAPIVTPVPELRGGCTWLFRAPELGALSDKGLMDHSGFLNASPLELLRGANVLAAHQRGDACDNGTAHTTLGMSVRVVGDVHASTWTLRWSSATEVMANRGKQGPQPLWYVVPGMTVELPIEGAWDPAWGKPVVNLAAVATHAAHPATLSWGAASADIPAGDGPVQVRLLGDPSGRVVVIHVPTDGPALAIHDLAFGEGEQASVALGTLAGATTPAVAAADTTEGVPTVTREGAPVRTPVKLGPKGKDCHYLVRLPQWEGLSDLRLFERYDLINGSPLVVWEGDALLVPHDRGGGCTGAFAHAADSLVIRPALDPETHGYVVGFDAAAEVVVDGRGGVRTTLWWGLPGTTLTWAWDAPLGPAPHALTVDLVSFGGTSPALLRSGEATLQIAPASGSQRTPIEGPVADGPWTLSLTVPDDGPVVMVRGVEPRAR
jgi:hypothetical protein